VRRLPRQVLAAAEADLEPDLALGRAEGRRGREVREALAGVDLDFGKQRLG
jgi:hypothetical protein